MFCENISCNDQILIKTPESWHQFKQIRSMKLPFPNTVARREYVQCVRRFAHQVNNALLFRFALIAA